VSHKGKIELKAKSETVEIAQVDWTKAIEQWSGAIKGHVGEELHDLMICDFTTTTAAVRTASQVVMMDAFQQYFDYHLMCVCGIPSITLQGSVEDWTRIRGRIEVMEGYHLDWWTDRLKPLCDGFIETAKGVPSKSFWHHIYKPKEVYGGKVITGWLADMFPYIKDPITRAPTVRNPILETPRHELRVEHGIAPSTLPTGLSCVPVFIHDPEIRKLGLVAGFLGVVQDTNTGSLRPEIGWAVVEGDEVSRLLEKLMPAYGESLPTDNSAPGVRGMMTSGVPKELIQVLDKAGAEHTFFADTDHPWRLKNPHDVSTQPVAGKGTGKIVTEFMELSDGRRIAYLPVQQFWRRSEEWWIIVGRLQTERSMTVQSVIAKGITQLLERMVSSGGRYYFDDSDFVPDCSLRRLSLGLDR
jgi:hypothetical protein